MALIRTTTLFLLAACAAHAADFVTIFDGKSLKGWDGDPQYWRVENGEIVGQTTKAAPTPHNTFLIWEGGDLEDFEIKVEFKLVNHNSGIQYRSFRLKDAKRPWGIGGYQADITEGPKYMGIAYGEAYKGIMAQRGEKVVLGQGKKNRKVVGTVGDPAEILSHIDLKGWNEYHIIARGNQCTQKINGVNTAEFTETGEDRLKKGLIALQLHKGPAMEVRFRNIRVRELAPEAPKQPLDSHEPK